MFNRAKVIDALREDRLCCNKYLENKASNIIILGEIPHFGKYFCVVRLEMGLWSGKILAYPACGTEKLKKGNTKNIRNLNLRNVYLWLLSQKVASLKHNSPSCKRFIASLRLSYVYSCRDGTHIFHMYFRSVISGAK